MYFKHPACEIQREYRFQRVRAMANVGGIFKIGTRGYIEFDWRARDPSLLPHIAIGPASSGL
jgi:hypothetical protein